MNKVGAKATVTRNLITWLIVAAILVLAAALAAYSLNLYQQTVAREAAADTVLNVTAEIAEEWRPEALLARADQELLDASPEDFWQRYIPSLQVLGTLRDIESLNTEPDIPPLWDRSRTARIDYRIRVRYDNDTATVQAQLVRRDGDWKIAEYLILTSLLAA